VASGYTAFMSTMITRGKVVWGVCKGLRKQRSATSASRVDLSRKSTVWLWESIAR
jgi:hypothetical protein